MSLLLILLLVSGCAPFSGLTQFSNVSLPQLPSVEAPVQVQQTDLRPPAQPCTGAFVTHDLPHVTSVPGDSVDMFEANGSGVGINDLDDDGDLDVVLANHAGPNSILWNTGGLRFSAERMEHGDSRAVNLVDVEGDGDLDIVFTRRMSGPNFWRNTNQGEGSQRFTLELLPGIYKPVYATNWADADGDNDLDLVAGSYDAGLLTDIGDSFLLSGGAGVYYHEQREGGFETVRLASSAQALAAAFIDLNNNGRPEILIGNDFALYDQTWTRQGDTWVETRPFRRTSHSTMSLDAGDIDNDGDWDIFTSDMKPYNNDVPTLAAWRPLMIRMREHPLPGDPQIMENMLQVRGADGGYRNEAYQRQVDATGWSWSGKFGDLDNDGWQDLYVVNGMIESEIFSYLPRHELVEQNQALRNDGRGHFLPAPNWKLGSTLSGRGMSMADLDTDGDLDIVVNNLRGPAQLFENRLCGGASLEFDLRWPSSKNTRALGATLALRTDQGVFYRDVRAASGYLSGDPSRVHFGIPRDASPLQLQIRWPDGAVSAIDQLTPHSLVTVTRR